MFGGLKYIFFALDSLYDICFLAYFDRLRVMNVVNTHIEALLIFFVFFPRKSLKICSRSILTFRRLTCEFLLSSNDVVKRKANSTIEQQILKGHEKRDRLLKFKCCLLKGRQTPLSNCKIVKVTKN